MGNRAPFAMNAIYVCCPTNQYYTQKTTVSNGFLNPNYVVFVQLDSYVSLFEKYKSFSWVLLINLTTIKEKCLE